MADAGLKAAGKDRPGAGKSARRSPRMAPEARRRELVEKAADFFSDEGFDAGTRQLARQLGVTQPLIYRYFSSKEELINAVYRKVYLDQWQDGWAETLRDRSRPMRDRLSAFYNSYAPAIFNRRWMRIFFFAGLKGLDINRRYLRAVAERLLLPIAEEMRVELGHAGNAPISQSEQELVWLMHGMVFYQGLRQHIYRSVDDVDYDFVVDAAIGMYLSRASGVISAALGLPEGQARAAADGRDQAACTTPSRP